MFSLRVEANFRGGTCVYRYGSNVGRLKARVCCWLGAGDRRGADLFCFVIVNCAEYFYAVGSRVRYRYKC